LSTVIGSEVVDGIIEAGIASAVGPATECQGDVVVGDTIAGRWWSIPSPFIAEGNANPQRASCRAAVHALLGQTTGNEGFEDWLLLSRRSRKAVRDAPTRFRERRSRRKLNESLTCSTPVLERGM
jgi:hypothetical protein